MKTLFIYNSFDNMAEFFILDGDYSHLDDTIINEVGNEDKANELNDLLFNKDGYSRVTMQDTLPDYKTTPWDKVVNVGFAP